MSLLFFINFIPNLFEFTEFMATLVQSEVNYISLRKCHLKSRPKNIICLFSCLPGIYHIEKKLEVSETKIKIFIFKNRPSSIINIAIKII